MVVQMQAPFERIFVKTVLFEDLRPGDLVQIYCRSRPMVVGTVIDRISDELLLTGASGPRLTVGRIEIIWIDRIHQGWVM